MTDAAARVVERVYREARMLAALIRTVGGFELAAEALQDACASALCRWADAVPDDPVARTTVRNGWSAWVTSG